jgi:hypothetical protein
VHWAAISGDIEALDALLDGGTGGGHSRGPGRRPGVAPRVAYGRDGPPEAGPSSHASSKEHHMFDVTFVAPNGETVAEFTRQNRQQVAQLLGHPPHCAALCRAEMRVQPC